MAKKVNKRNALINARFLNAVEIVLKKNAAAGLEPSSERALSLIISSDHGTISKIQRGERSATREQIDIFGNKFNLDFNCFFRNVPIKYEVYINKAFRNEKTGDLVTRMADRFPMEIMRMEQVILTFGEVVKNLAKEKGDPAAIKQARKALADGKAKLLEAFTKI